MYSWVTVIIATTILDSSGSLMEDSAGEVMEVSLGSLVQDCRQVLEWMGCTGSPWKCQDTGWRSCGLRGHLTRA